jgi:site-specific DNA-cytosine methylase
MSFDDSFVFPEDQAMTSVARQIGNAVPPLLAHRIAESLAAHLDAAAEVISEVDTTEPVAA